MTASISMHKPVSARDTEVIGTADISRLTHAEAGRLAQTEFERLLALLETLDGDDWWQPTYCTDWHVRDMTAHLAGAAAGSASLAEFRHQNMANPYARQSAEPVDDINKLQLADRAGRSPAELVAEFRDAGQKAVTNRQKLPWLVRQIRLPMGPSIGLGAIGYLMDVIYPRDQWMHRYDISAATGREMSLTVEHDGRMMALVMVDLARKLKKQLQGRTILLILGGPAGGRYFFGDKAAADCTIQLDAWDFNLLASGRITPDAAVAKARIEGDPVVARWFLDNAAVPY